MRVRRHTGFFVFILTLVIPIFFFSPDRVAALEAPPAPRESEIPALEALPAPRKPEIPADAGSDHEPGLYATPPVWRATGTVVMDGRLIYKDIDIRIAPGMTGTMDLSWNLTKGAGRCYKNTVVKFPDTAKTIYHSGLVQNYLEYKIMAGKNWQFAKLSADDFSDAGRMYALEGNWGLLQTGYYCLKGTSRVVWALAILNSGEAVWKIVQAGGETVYYLLRYPVGGILQTAGAPLVLGGGTAWTTVAAVVTTGWALPFTAAADAFRWTGRGLWAE